MQGHRRLVGWRSAAVDEVRGQCPDCSLVLPTPAGHNLMHCCWGKSGGFHCLSQADSAPFYSQLLLLPFSSCSTRWPMIKLLSFLILPSSSMISSYNMNSTLALPRCVHCCGDFSPIIVKACH